MVALPDLPIVEVIDELRDALAAGRHTVLVAPPGAGKTTVAPLALLDEPWLAGRRIVVLEPRRLAARAAARRMAALVGDDVGDTVGYQTRDERRIGAATRIEVLTEGILTRRLQHDPELPGIGLVVFDEVHERNLPTDLGLALTLDVGASIRPDLRVLAMSATIDVAALRRVLDDPVVIESRGRAFPVDVRWQPRGQRERIEPATAAAVRRALGEAPGDVLVFLPGIGEITRTAALLREAIDVAVDIRPLAGALTLAEQDAALAPSPPGRRRVVLATDIAETSLTVEGVRVVVDSGLARAPRFDPRTGMTRLTTITTSRDAAEQRAGRAGRVDAGVCYRLWSKLEHGTRQAHRTPEIADVDLAGLVLELAAWGSPVDDLRFPDRPPAKAFAAAQTLLVALGALDADHRITDVGRRMLAMPVHPRLAHMIVAEGSALACVVAALLDERDVFRGRPDELPADLARRVAAVCGDVDEHADRGAVQRARALAADIARRARLPFELSSVDPDRTGAALLLAFPDRLAARRRPGQFQLRTGSAAWLPPTDPLAHEPFLVAADLDGKRDRARIRLAAAIDADAVARTAGDDLVETTTLRWDDERDDLVAEVERRLGSLRLGHQLRPAPPSDETTDALLRRVRETRLAVLGWSSAAVALRRRVDFLHRALGAPWPDWSVEHLTATLDDWLRPFVAGATSRLDLEVLEMTTVLRSMLPWPHGADVDRLAPPSLELPSGRTVPIDYDDVPSAHVRVQDLFGVDVHPTAASRPIVLHLLSPADRPLQVTSDLPGFWRGSWADVRKEMAGRYPKHHWPDDPTAAPPRRLRDR